MQTNTSEHEQTDLKDWISLAEAAARLPSPRAGKRTHTSTVYRLAVKHGLEIRRRGHYRFVCWPDLVALMQPDQVMQPRPATRANSARRTLAETERTQRVLRENGII